VPLTQDPTKNFHRKIQTVVQQCNNVIQKQKCKYYNNNPEPPSIRALIKLHKNPLAIRPIINWTHAPAYQLASRVAFYLKHSLNLPNSFNITNTTDLISDLNEVKISQDNRICSFDIVNMYTNIPTDIISNIITEVLYKLGTHAQITRELILIISTILDQNYFKFNNQFFQQTEGLPMGAPTSSILSEVFLQYIEHINIVNILSKFHIESYNRYVDDILLIYNKTKTNIQEVLEEFNKIHQNLQFTLEQENNNAINF
jgi:hypothetical protein